MKVYDGEAVVEVGSESACLQHLVQVGVGGGDDLQRDLVRRELAEGKDLTAVEETKQLRLNLKWQVGDLVEE